MLDGVQIRPWEGINFGERGAKCKVGHAVTCAKTAEPIMMPFGLWARIGPRSHELNWGPDPPCEQAIFGERVAYCEVYTSCRELRRNG